MMLIWCWWCWWWWWWRWWRPQGRLFWKSCWWSKYDFALWYLAEPACLKRRRTGGSSCFQRGFLAPTDGEQSNSWRLQRGKYWHLGLWLCSWLVFDDVVSFIYHIFSIDHKTYQIMLMVWSPYSHVLVDIKLYVMHLPVILFGRGCLIVVWTAHLPTKKPPQNTSHALIF